MKNLKALLLMLLLFTLVACKVSVSSTTTNDTSTTTTTANNNSTTTKDSTTSVTTTSTELVTTTEQSTTTTENNIPPYDTTYYHGVDGLTGETLKQALHNIIDDHHMLTYDEAWEALKETDEDPNNPNNVILFYSGISRSKNKNGGQVGDWNREHVWAKSHGDFGTSKGPGTDIHHLRPTDTQVNSNRGNKDFDYGGSSYSKCTIYVCKSDSDSFEPDDRVKGDVARIIFYMAVRYEGDDSFRDLELNEKVNNGSNPYMGKLSVLLEWNELDPVDDYERNRNEVIFKWQNNRNPFIDNPEWAKAIWLN